MLTVSLRYASTRTSAKIRVLKSPQFVGVGFCSAPSSASVSSPPTCFLTTLAQPNTESDHSHGDSLAATKILTAFKDWFKTGSEKNQLVIDIFKILRSPGVDEDPRALDLALSGLGFRLTEELVVRVLEHGKKDVLSCLKFFDWTSRQSGFYHTRPTLYAIFKILRGANLMSLILEFLNSNLKSHSYASALRINETLVMGYAMAGKPEVALNLFSKMRFRGLDLDDFGYHVLLNTLVEESCFEAADVICQQISDKKFDCGVTHCIMVKGLVRQNRLAEAEQHFRGLLRKGEVPRGYNRVLSSLVDALNEDDMFDKAQRLLEDCRELGVLGMEQAYGIWIKFLVQVGNLDEALNFLKSKRSLEGYVPEVFVYNVLLRQLVETNRLKEVCDIIIEMKECGISPDKGTMNVVLCFFCKAGMVSIAHELYSSSSEFGITPDVIDHNYLINTLCADGNVDEAYIVLKTAADQGLFPGRKTFTVLADALCKEKKLETLKEMAFLSFDSSFVSTASVYEKFISTLCRASRVEEAHMIHEELGNKNIATSKSIYASLISGFIHSKRTDISARLLIEMQEKGFIPKPKLYRAVIRGLCNMENSEIRILNLLEMQLSRLGRTFQVYNLFIDGIGHARKSELARQVFERMVKERIDPSLKSEIYMLEGYLKSEKISEALNFFNGLSHRRAIRRRLYNVMIAGLCKINKADIAIHFLQEAREKEMSSSVYCYGLIIQNLCANGRFETALCILQDYKRSGRRITSFMGNVFLYNALKSESLYKAWIQEQNFEEATDISLLGQVIGVFSGYVGLTIPIEKLDEVIGRCFPLSLYTYNLLLRKLSKRHKEDAVKIFDRLLQKGYEPNEWTLDIMKICILNSERTEAKKWLKLMYRNKSGA